MKWIRILARRNHAISPANEEREGGVARLKLLLDTHIWLWILHNPKKVGKRLLQELRNEANKLWLSPAVETCCASFDAIRLAFSP